MKTVTSVTSRNVEYEIGDAKARKEKLNIVDLPSNISAFVNDLNFIDNTVSDLANYYRKSETYTKAEIDEKLATRWNSKFVDELPTEDISPTTIYFVPRPKTEQEQSDIYDEYIYVSDWELIGNTYVDLSDYYTKSETNTQIDTKITKENQDRELSETILQTHIDAVQSNLNSTNSQLESEILSRQQINIRHDNLITELNSNLSAESDRIDNIENSLSEASGISENHISDTSNPHNVTAEQVGLGNVTNIGTTSTITPNSNENITSGAVYTALNEKVDKVEGKGLSDQNFTYAEKTKLSGLENYDDSNLIARISANENAISTLNGNTSVSGSVDKKIADAIANVTQIDFKIVSKLPATGVKGTIYFVSVDLETGNIYDEYVWLNNSWELLNRGSLTVDLVDYYKKNETNALLSGKNDKITVVENTDTLSDTSTFSTTSNGAGSNPTNLTKRPLSTLWTYISNKIKSTNQAINGITFEIV